MDQERIATALAQAKETIAQMSREAEVQAAACASLEQSLARANLQLSALLQQQADAATAKEQMIEAQQHAQAQAEHMRIELEAARAEVTRLTAAMATQAEQGAISKAEADTLRLDLENAGLQIASLQNQIAAYSQQEANLADLEKQLAADRVRIHGSFFNNNKKNSAGGWVGEWAQQPYFLLT